MGTVFGRPYVPSTLGSFLREYNVGHVRQLDAVASPAVDRLHDRTRRFSSITFPLVTAVRNARRSVLGRCPGRGEHAHAPHGGFA